MSALWEVMHVVTDARPEVCNCLSEFGKPTIIFVCFCTCLGMLLTNGKLYFLKNCFCVFVD